MRSLRFWFNNDPDHERDLLIGKSHVALREFERAGLRDDSRAKDEEKALEKLHQSVRPLILKYASDRYTDPIVTEEIHEIATRFKTHNLARALSFMEFVAATAHEGDGKKGAPSTHNVFLNNAGRHWADLVEEKIKRHGPEETAKFLEEKAETSCGLPPVLLRIARTSLRRIYGTQTVPLPPSHP